MTILTVSFGVFGQPDFERISVSHFPVLVLFLFSTFGAGVFNEFDMLLYFIGDLNLKLNSVNLSVFNKKGGHDTRRTEPCAG